MIAETRAATRRAGPATGVSVDDAPDDDWLGMYHYRGQDLAPIAAWGSPTIIATTTASPRRPSTETIGPQP
jgi:hypothetical protein